MDLIVELAGEENDEIEREIMALMNVDERNISESQVKPFQNSDLSFRGFGTIYVQSTITIR